MSGRRSSFNYKWGDWVRSNDRIVNPFYTELHCGTFLESRTLFGGFASLCIKAYVLSIAVDQGLRMFYYINPYINSQEVSYNSIETQIPITDTSKVLIEFW